VDSERTAFGDQTRARQRAATYFALLAILKRPAEANEAWDRISDHGLQLDLDDIGSLMRATGRIDLDATALSAERERVKTGLRQLVADDLLLELGTTGYPHRIAKTPDAPRFLFVRQGVNVLDLPAVAIVGTREASPEGQARARKLAQLLAKREIAVVSGLARGIDAAAHQGALDVGGVTIAVIGTPLTRAYPAENSELQKRIAKFGAVISQFAPSSKTLPLCFPLRNATMSALSLGTVVIEASETSGALIQARKALQQGRKLFIPRSAVEDERLRWPRKYAAEGAHVFATIEDLVSVLDREGLLPAFETSPPPIPVGVGAS